MDRARAKLNLAVIGVALLIAGRWERILASNACDVPREITCTDLIRNGPGDNLHVQLTKFMVGDEFVLSKDGQSALGPAAARGGEWDLACRKAAREGERRPPLHGFKLLLMLPRARRVESLTHETSVRGMLVQKIKPLHVEERARLSRSYPQAELSDVMILEVGRQPAGSWGYLIGYVGGALCLLAAAYWTFVDHRNRPRAPGAEGLLP